MRICGVNYRLNKPYNYPKVDVDRLVSINKIINTLAFCRFKQLPSDFDMKDEDGSLKSRLIKHISANLLGPQGWYSRTDAILNATYILNELKNIEDGNRELTVIFKKHFHWPEGYFNDGGKCWHTYNNACPVFWQDQGARWITVYSNGEPLGRAGIIPLGDRGQMTVFNATGIPIMRLAKLFVKPGWVTMYTSLYNHGGVSDDDRRAGYTNESVALVRDGENAISHINVPEYGYEFDECMSCGCSIIPLYRDEHVCGQHHKIDKEYLS